MSLGPRPYKIPAPFSPPREIKTTFVDGVGKISPEILGVQQTPTINVPSTFDEAVKGLSESEYLPDTKNISSVALGVAKSNQTDVNAFGGGLGSLEPAITESEREDQIQQTLAESAGVVASVGVVAAIASSVAAAEEEEIIVPEVFSAPLDVGLIDGGVF